MLSCLALSWLMVRMTSPCWLARHAGRIPEIQHRVAFARGDTRPGTGWEETRSPLPGGDRLVLSSSSQRGQDDEAGQVLRFGAQSVNHPGTHAGRPAICEPVFMNMCAGSWLMASVVMDRTRQISSMTEPICGNSSQIWVWFLPKGQKLVLRAETKQFLPL